jgi:DNA-binding MarR family transcriptional regulator
MGLILQDTREYLEKVFGDKPIIHPWSGRDFLPNYLINLYEYYRISFLNTDFILLMGENNKPFKMKDIKKHFYQLKKYLNSNIVYIFETISNYQRNQLIEGLIPFVVPYKHLYIPFLGIAFSERFATVKPKVDHLSPAGQSLFFELITPGVKISSQAELAAQLGIEKMSISRAFHELEQIGVLYIEKLGRCNKWKLTKRGWDLWDTIENYLINPILSKVYVRNISSSGTTKLITSGESALAESTLLGSPVMQTFAISKKDWKKTKGNYSILSDEEDSDYCIEIWKHKVPIYQGKINPLALYLTLKDNHDERVQKSLEDLKAHYPWEDIMYD